MVRLKSLFSHKFSKVLLFMGMLLLTACDCDSAGDVKQLQEKFNSPEGCIPCQLFRVIYNASAAMSSAAYDTMCDIALSLLTIGLTAWLLWHVLKLIVSLREPDITSFWVELLQMLFKGGAVAIVVGSKKHLYSLINSVLEPIALIFIDLSTTLLQSSWTSKATVMLYSRFTEAPGFPSRIGQAVENLIYRVTVALNVGRVLGLRLMFSCDFANFWLGLFLSIIFFLMVLFFPFYLLDGFIKLTLVFALLPLFLVAWVFKKTASFLIKAWDIVFGSFVQIMIACIFISIFISVFEGFAAIRGFGYLFAPAVQDIDRLFQEDANQMSFTFLTFMMIAQYMYSLSKKISEFAAQFADAPKGNVVGQMIDAAKKTIRALIMVAIAVAATAVGLGPVAQAAAKQAKQDATSVAKGAGGKGG